MDPLLLLSTQAATPSRLAAGRFFFSSPDTGISVAAVGLAPESEELPGLTSKDEHGPASAGGSGPIGPAEPGLTAGVGPGRTAGVEPGQIALVVLPFDAARESGPVAPGSPWHGMSMAAVTVPQVCVFSRRDETVVVATSSESGEDAKRTAEQVAAALLKAAESTPVAGSRGAGVGASRGAPHGAAPSDSPAAVRMSADNRHEARRRVTAALAAIDGGQAAKIVVSTSLSKVPTQPPDPVAVLGRLRAAQPEAFTFLYEPVPGGAFVGASPERLVSVSGRAVRSMALAGSAPRGQDEDSDRALGEALLASRKDRTEHAMVVDAVCSGLEPATSSLDVRGEPRLKRLAGIQHLETPIEGTLAEPASVLDLAKVLHPTPALAGTPREASMELIRLIEGGSRGLYGGAIGWMDGEGDGDLSVAIRCLLLLEDSVTAFAGAGVVAGSDPDAEVREMELKLRTVLSAA